LMMKGARCLFRTVASDVASDLFKSIHTRSKNHSMMQF